MHVGIYIYIHTYICIYVYRFIFKHVDKTDICGEYTHVGMVLPFLVSGFQAPMMLYDACDKEGSWRW